MEVAIGMKTARAKSGFKDLPKCYKVDLGDEQIRLAVEVDGRGHLRPSIQKKDAKKTQALEWLGWTVLRFTNEEVDRDLNGCLKKIQCITSMLKTTKTISRKEC
jgi:very-short-patch-repair endonuclease